jgi:hypothetical protein
MELVMTSPLTMRMAFLGSLARCISPYCFT